MLGDWLDRHHLSRKEFADLILLPRTHVDLLCRGKRNPGLDIALHIEEATKEVGEEIPVEAWRQEKTLKELRATAGTRATNKPVSKKPKAKSKKPKPSR